MGILGPQAPQRDLPGLFGKRFATPEIVHNVWIMRYRTP